MPYDVPNPPPQVTAKTVASCIQSKVTLTFSSQKRLVELSVKLAFFLEQGIKKKNENDKYSQRRAEQILARASEN
jgi:hypothetical protein